jgi:hypothetical protein
MTEPVNPFSWPPAIGSGPEVWTGAIEAVVADLKAEIATLKNRVRTLEQGIATLVQDTGSPFPDINQLPVYVPLTRK